ncbi:MAG: hypothetical protein LBM77_07585 [Spirochaetaceae bacterium]|jgi:tetratricopeptide (TPR) repeat protein|nr:hypothetical protein [Spirochaetaceae bacterium]
MKNRLPLILTIGFLLALVALAGIVYFNAQIVFSSEVRREPGDSNFSFSLREYDAAADVPFYTGKDARLARMLNNLEDEALGVEELLSVLKRRRALLEDESSPAAIRQYKEAVDRSCNKYPYSQTLAITAIEAYTVYAISNADFQKALSYLSVIDSTEYPALYQAAHILAGTLNTPDTAFSRTGGADVFDGLNQVLLDLIEGDSSGALMKIRALQVDAARLDPANTDSAYKDKLNKLEAEILYDYGDPTTAAEYFSKVNSGTSISRQADSLALAGRLQAAKTFWSMLSNPNSTDTAADSKLISNSLYNLAATETDGVTKAANLEKLLSRDPGNVYGLILYTRMQGPERALAILTGIEDIEGQPLLALELLRRRQSELSIDQMVAQTWLLINRHPGDENIYRWAAWYFSFQRRFDELNKLLGQAKTLSMELDADGAILLPYYESVYALSQGRIDDSEKILQNLVQNMKESSPYKPQVYAGLGLTLEKKQSYLAALDNYTKALDVAVSENPLNNKMLVKLNVSSARCLRVLGRTTEARALLETAATLAPLDPQVRLELDRTL